jgi:hypothetical protein
VRIATVKLASVSTVRRIIELSIRWVSLIGVSECQRGGDRRGVMRRLASALASEIERSGQTS